MGSRPTARCFRHFVAIAVSKPQPESRALADCRRTLRLQAVVFSSKGWAQVTELDKSDPWRLRYGEILGVP
ncbi:MAG: hypothetical protein ABGX16_12265 [Pirellulales bacterium]